MHIEKRKDLYLKIDKMIRDVLSDDVSIAAEKLNVSKNTILQCLEEMRMLGAPIIHDRLGDRYVYPVNGNFRFEQILKKELNVVIDDFILNNKML